ncbi:MAG: gp16 family protein [Planktomarina sp.]
MAGSRSLQRQIHMACRDLGVDNDTRRDMQLVVCGKASMKDMDDADLQKMVQHLKDKGWSGGAKSKGAKSKGYFKPAPRADLRKIHVLWRLLGNAGHLKDPSRKGLNAFIHTRFETTWGSVPLDVDQMRDAKKISMVITALQNWCNTKGVETQ